MKRVKSLPVVLVALATLGSGLINLCSLIGPSLPERLHWLRQTFPLDFIHLSRFLTLLAGFTLVVSSLNIYRRKKRAFQVVFLVSCASIVFHLTKGLDYEEATFSLVLLGILFLSRGYFTVKSSVPSWRLALTRLAIAFAVAMAYGVAGFWFLERREFGIDFSLKQSVIQTLRSLTFAGDPTLVPHSHYAAWFLNSLALMTVIVVAYASFSLFRPVLYLYRTLPQERERAAAIVRQHGRSAQEFFKYWPDKSFHFSPSADCFLAYRVGRGFAVVLGDPVGPEDQIAETVTGFAALCQENGWGHGFHQTLPDFLPIYQALGYRKLKIGDDAVVDLRHFNLEGPGAKQHRNTIRRLENMGAHTGYYEPPLLDQTLDLAQEVSDEWLQIPGRRERGFTLGQFARNYLRTTPLFAVLNDEGHFLAFANLVPSSCEGEATIDLMRHRLQAPNGTMDYLFIKLFLHQRAQGFTRFNLGMAPMAGFQEHEQATREERAIHYFMQQMNFLFSFSGLRQYKAKFASTWEPRYAVYPHPMDLPRLALALRSIAESVEA